MPDSGGPSIQIPKRCLILAHGVQRLVGCSGSIHSYSLWLSVCSEYSVVLKDSGLPLPQVPGGKPLDDFVYSIGLLRELFVSFLG